MESMNRLLSFRSTLALLLSFLVYLPTDSFDCSSWTDSADVFEWSFCDACWLHALKGSLVRASGQFAGA
jgi:hypothetical protein